MTDENNQGHMISQEELNQAAASEQEVMSMSPEVLSAQNRHLSDRVVLLRARVIQLEGQVEALTVRKAPQDRQPKKTATKKTAAKKKVERPLKSVE